MIPNAENDVLGPRAMKSVLRQANLPTLARAPGSARFLVITEQTPTGFSSYAPDLVGCVAVGTSIAVVEAAMREAIEGHLEELEQAGMPIPQPRATSTYLEVTA